jgi:hypothetical protein
MAMDKNETTQARSETEVRSAALARIRSLAATLSALGTVPGEPFVWTHQRRSRWWAFGPFGRYTVTTPVRLGWSVGDYPWEGWVLQGRDRYLTEVFIRPTFVDPDGRIAPLDAGRGTPPDNPLLTASMCAEIAAALEELTKVGTDVLG